MAVKRFRPPYVSSDENRMVTDTGGCYVLASDYDALYELAKEMAQNIQDINRWTFRSAAYVRRQHIGWAEKMQDLNNAAKVLSQWKEFNK